MKIICYGDSNTYGYDPRSYFGGRYASEERWVDILGELSGWVMINAGENGREIPHRSWELDGFVRLVQENSPMDMLSLMLGTNDLLLGNPVDVVAERMERLLNCIALKFTSVVLIAPPPMKLGEWVTEQCILRASAELASVYRGLAERQDILFADAGEWNAALGFDGVHLTPEGHRAFAEGMYQYLKKEIELCWKQE